MSPRRPGWWNPFRQAVFLIDALVRRVSHYEEFTHDPRCIFRVVWSKAPYTYTFSDGTCVPHGAPILVLHFWNERIPLMPAAGPDLKWALEFYRLLRYSLTLVANYLESHPRGTDIQALYGRIFLDIQEDAGDTGSTGIILRRLGFELTPSPLPTTWTGRVGFFFVRGYALALAWAFNPGSVHVRSTWHKRATDVWMPRHVLTWYRQQTTPLSQERGMA